MRINLNQMFVFYLAARMQSMSLAAESLYVTPPAVTMQIKKLETWLGFPVFLRESGDIRLTERGKELYDLLESMFVHVGDVEAYLQDVRRGEATELRLGTHHLPGNYFIPDLIAHVHAAFPGLKVRMELGTQDALLEKLLEQQLDLALVIGDPPDGEAYRKVFLFEEELALVTAPAGRLGKINAISVRDIGKIPLILQQKGSGARQMVLDYLRGHGVEPDVMLDNISSDVIKQFLPKMQAGSFIGRFIVQRELDQGLLHEISVLEGSPVCRFNLVCLDRRPIPRRVRDFLSGLAGFSPSFRTKKHPAG